MNQRITKSLVWILTGFIAFIFIGSGIFKLVGGVKTVEMAQSVGGRSNLIILAFLEFVIAILFLIPRTGVVGILLMIAYMGGALAVLFVSGQPFIF
ncbi:MAG: DoxX family protein [Saprospiraceae bacterium]|nr:DoxX family protein [Saprospiraceae bacterium]